MTKPNGREDCASATASESAANAGGGFFDPAEWRSPGSNRLDPTSKIPSSAVAKIEVRKPPKDHFIRVHPDPGFNEIFSLYSDSEAKRYDPYLLSPKLTLPPQVQSNVVPTRLAVAITDSGKLFLWWVPQTGSNGTKMGMPRFCRACRVGSR